MSMFSFPTEMNLNEMMKPMNAMTDWTKTEEMPVSPLMIHPLGAAAAATAIGFGIAGQMAGMMMGVMQGAMKNQGELMGAHPDMSWIIPTLAEDLAPEEEEADADAEPVSKAMRADVVELKPVAKPKADAKPAKTKTAPAKAKAVKAEAPAKDANVAVVEKLKSDAEIAAAAASETAPATKSAATEAAPELQPEDFRRPAEIEKPESPDDLKLISGIGPKLEQVLNGLGVWTFAQIAGWQPEEAAWVDDYLQFSGRIERDDWIKQAGTLAKGGAAA